MGNLDPPDDVNGPQPPLFYLPETDGSTSTQPLDTFVACTLAQWDLVTERDGAVTFLFPKGQSVDQNAAAYEQVGRALEKRRGLARPIGRYKHQLNPRWTHSGTHGAYISLIHGQSGLIYVARGPSELERRTAKRHDFDLNVQPIAKDAFVFLVHDDNPVDTLTLTQIRRIYTGKVTNWKAFGGPDQKITPFQRDPQSGSQQLMIDLVMEDQSIANESSRGKGLVYNSMRGAINAIDEEPAGIGYSVFFYRNHLQPGEHTKLLAVDGVKPTKKTIASDEYPLTTKIYAASRTAGKGDRLEEWLLTEEGQRVVATSGYVPVDAPTDDGKTNRGK